MHISVLNAYKVSLERDISFGLRKTTVATVKRETGKAVFPKQTGSLKV